MSVEGITVKAQLADRRLLTGELAANQSPAISPLRAIFASIRGWRVSADNHVVPVSGELESGASRKRGFLDELAIRQARRAII